MREMLLLWKTCLESDKVPDTINGFTSGLSGNSRVLSSIRLFARASELSISILLILLKSVIDATIELLSDILDSLNAKLVGILFNPTSMVQEILLNDIFGT